MGKASRRKRETREALAEMEKNPPSWLRELEKVMFQALLDEAAYGQAVMKMPEVKNG